MVNLKAKNILTIDYEDWHTTSHYSSVITQYNKKYLIEEPTYKLLDVLEKSQTKATFFVLGQVAKDCPKLIKIINRKGHEIASHGFTHKGLHLLSPKQFEKEIIESKKVLEDITQKRVLGYRAPFFSLTSKTSWAIEILKQQGFIYDSSVFPMVTTRYGIKNAPLAPYYIQPSDIKNNDQSEGIIELPISIFKNSLLSIPCSGGIYARLLPYAILQNILKKIAGNRPIIFYLHPWELINKTHIAPYPGLRKNFLANFNTGLFLNKIEYLINDFEFSSAENYIKNFSISHSIST